MPRLDGHGRVGYLLGKAGATMLMVVIAVICLFPPAIIVSTSLKELQDVFKIPAGWIPTPFAWSNYVEIWDQIPMVQWLYNSTVVAVGTILLSLAIAIPAGYAFARLRFPGKSVVIMTTLLTQMFSPVIIIGPLFRLFKTLHLLDSHIGLILGNTAFSLAFSTLLMSSFFEMMPKELEDAALIDGCGRLQSLLRIFIPLASSGIFVVSIYIFIQAWNNFLFAFTFISSSEKDILIVGIYKMVQLSTGQMPKWNYVMVTSVYSSIPIVVLFFLRRRTLARGLTAGAIR